MASSFRTRWKDLLEILLGAVLGVIVSVLLQKMLAEPIFLFAIFVIVVVILTSYFTFRELYIQSKRLNDFFAELHDLSSVLYDVQSVLKQRATDLISKDEKELVKHFIEVINNANEYIMCTGGISRQENYLESIESRTQQGIEYWRVFAGPEISEETLNHLRKVMKHENTHIGLLPEGTIYSYILVTEDVGIVTLPDPAAFRSFLITREEVIVDRLKMYVQQLLGQATELKAHELDRLIEDNLLKVKPRKQ